MTITVPTTVHVRTAAEYLGLPMSDAQVVEIRAELVPIVELLAELDELPEQWPEIRYPRTPGERPDPEQNPLNGWAIRSSISGSAHGPLRGHRIVVKDTVCAAGVPMSAGSSTLEGFSPDIDATVVTRILDAGGEIAGKATCEYFCYGASSHTSASGPVRNPYDPIRTAGGSSSGTAVLVATGAVSMGIGGDQGGSIRIPAAHCGVCGLKPTHGFVPYTGIFPVDPCLDHAGPMTATVADNAQLLEVVAGADGMDPRQLGVRTERCSEALGIGASGLRIGLLVEGFGQPLAEPGVESLVRAHYDAAFAEVDLLAMPTVPFVAQPIPVGRSRRALVARIRPSGQHRAFRLHRAPRTLGAMRAQRWTSGRPDAGRQALGGVDDLPRRRGAGEGG